MSQFAQVRQLVEDTVRELLKNHKDGGADDGDVTQLKRENTGLRNRVKALEENFQLLDERVDALENAARPSASAKAGTASGKGTAHSTK